MNIRTIDDIADELGLSKSTVSRAISGKGRISEATRQRVQRCIEQYNYTPSAVARGLAQKRTFNIGVVCPIDYEIFDLQYFHRCLHGISDVASLGGYDMLISMVSDRDISNLRRVVENHKADGIILTRSLFDDAAAAYLKQSGMPAVIIGSSPDPDIVQVDNDHLNGCCELTSVLLAKGCRKIALIGGDNTHTVTAVRKKGFELAFEQMGIPLDPALIYMDTQDERAVGAALEDIMRRKADCVICMDEKLTSFAVTECRHLKIRIPDDLRMASFYNSAFLETTTPAITALDIDDRKLGAAAARHLLAMIEGKPSSGELLRSYQVILRESTMLMNTAAV